MSPVRVPKRGRAVAKSTAIRLRLLPSYREPEIDESLLSWTLRLAGDLGVSMNVFSRRILGIDSTPSDSAWWTYPSAFTLARLAAKTDLPPAQLKRMTFAEWAPKFRDDDARERFSGIRLQNHLPACRRETRLAVCGQCLGSYRAPFIPLSWTLGWLAICPVHKTVMLVRCPHCTRRLQLPSFTKYSRFNPARCTHCLKPLFGPVVPAYRDAIKLQSILLQGKRIGVTALPGIGELTWPQTVTFLDLLINLLWTGTSFEERWHFTEQFAEDYSPVASAEMSPYHSRYGGMCMLAWLLDNSDQGRGANVTRQLLSRWLAGGQEQASRFAGIKTPITSSAAATLWDTPETRLRSLLVAACGGNAHTCLLN